MSTYTTLNDPEIDEKVNNIVEFIKNEIVKNFHPKSIILKGSFGRGEISVIKENTELKLLSDCEIIVIKNKHKKGIEYSELSENLIKTMGLKIEMGELELELDFCLKFHLWNKILPTIDNYELKYGSRSIYGENFLEKIPDFKAEDIPVWEGIRLMFNRMVESLEYFSVKYFIEYPSKENEFKLFFWTNKIILACQDALLILAKKYHYSYKIRGERFQEIFPKSFTGLNKEIPNFLSLTKIATEYKLNPSENYVKDVIKFWFEVAEIVDKVFRFIIEEDMGIKFYSYIEFQEKYLKHPYIRKKYYRGLSPNPLYQNFRSAMKMRILGHKFPSIKFVQKGFIPWSHLVYSYVPLIYFGIVRNNGCDESYLKYVNEILGLKSSNDQEISSRYLFIKEFLNLWRTTCY
ncbi:MAG: hypothetical protein WA130_04470 [Candidatus Methanoperedens sp.]